MYACYAPDSSEELLRERTHLVQVGEVQIQKKGVTSTSIDAPVKISLHDCLACSGCVTTAETVLLEQQSISQFMEKLHDDSVDVVITLSNQSIASISAKLEMNPLLLCQKLCRIFKACGAHAVFDLSVASQIALLENCLEFERRIRDNANLPMMTSSCPGWICYVEKSHPHLLPFISSIKSPQAIMGTLIKRFWGTKVKDRQRSIFHVTVMPCYDKKLESAREELVLSSNPETDCVLTTTELEKWIQDNKVDLSQESEELLDSLFDEMECGGRAYISTGDFPALGKSDNIESDGYMNYLYRRVCLQEGIDLLGYCVPTEHGRNADVKESSLHLRHGRQLKFAIVNGFRNIQGLVRKMKTKKCTYDYVEVMACPSGCLNGGGQLPLELPENQDEANKIKQCLFSQTSNAAILSNAMIQCELIYKNWINDGPGSKNAMLHFSTTYKERKLLSGGSNVDW